MGSSLRHCDFCGSKMHLVRGTWRHYGTMEACERIKKYQMLVARHHALRPDTEKNVQCPVCHDAGMRTVHLPNRPQAVPRGGKPIRYILLARAQAGGYECMNLAPEVGTSGQALDPVLYIDGKEYRYVLHQQFDDTTWVVIAEEVVR